jgi:hypothetical protein
MSDRHHDRSLQLEHDQRFHEREWRAGTVTWFLLLALIVATLLGAFGDGWLSRARAGDPESALSVEYERIARFGSAQRLVVHARPGPDGMVRLRMGPSLVDAFHVVRITPEPAAAALAADGLDYRFPSQGTGQPIVFDLESTRTWFVAITVQTDEAALRCAQFIFP